MHQMSFEVSGHPLTSVQHFVRLLILSTVVAVGHLSFSQAWHIQKRGFIDRCSEQKFINRSRSKWTSWDSGKLVTTTFDLRCCKSSTVLWTTMQTLVSLVHSAVILASVEIFGLPMSTVPELSLLASGDDALSFTVDCSCSCSLANSCVSTVTAERSFWIVLRADTRQVSHTQPRVEISVFKYSCSFSGTGKHLTWYTALHISQDISSLLLDIKHTEHDVDVVWSISSFMKETFCSTSWSWSVGDGD